MKKFICDRHFMKTVLRIALPLMLQQLISVSVNLVDNLMVGSLGDAAIGSVAAVNKFYMIAVFGVNGLTAAGAVFIAQFFGAQQERKMQESFRVMLVCSALIMALFTLTAAFLHEPILRYYTSDPAVIAAGSAYLQLALYSFLPAAVTLCIYSAMRAVGEMQIPLRTSVGAVLMNAVLNYILIYGKLGFPQMGIRGAAMATLLARLLEMVFALFMLKRKPFAFKTKLTEIADISPDLFRQVIVKAAPLMLNEILWSFGMATIFKFYASRGSDVMSGDSIAGTISDLFFTMFGGMAAASTVLISTPLGANRLDEARDNAYRLIGFSVFLALLFAALIFASSFLVPVLYANVSAGAQKVAMQFIRITSVMFWIYMASTECYFILRAGGDMKHTLLMDSGFMWGLTIPVMAVLTYLTNADYLLIYIAGQMIDFVKLLFSYWLVRREHWVVNLTVQE